MNLKNLSDKALLTSALSLVSRERQILIEVLWHLKEIDNRKLYSDLKCSSLFDYCVTVLKYSEGQASRRVSAARLLKEVPKLAVHIENGSINLTQLNQAKSFFDENQIQKASEKEDVILKLSGKSTRESEKMLWEMKGESTPKKVTIIVREETLLKLKRVQSLNSHKCTDMDSLMTEMCSEVEKIWEKSPKRSSAGAKTNTRYISKNIESAVWKRDQGKCKICGGQSRLELDHIKPFAHGGQSTLENLRLLCRNCNQRAGIKIFGLDRRASHQSKFFA